MRTIKAIILFIAIAVANIANAQEAPYKFDFGAGIGVSGYAGDAASSVFDHPGFVGEAAVRYIPNTRMAFRAVLSALTLSGNTADMTNVPPLGKQYSFSSQAYDLGVRYEFNFFSYGIGETYKRLRRWTPYLTLGLGMTLATCDGNNAFGVNLPMGAGIKYKLKERLNLGIEFTMTKVFNDHVDGRELSDLTTIKSSFVKNNDWYSRFTIGITYEFGKRCETCHYVE
jgi:hypothetical protein